MTELREGHCTWFCSLCGRLFLFLHKQMALWLCAGRLSNASPVLARVTLQRSREVGILIIRWSWRPLPKVVESVKARAEIGIQAPESYWNWWETLTGLPQKLTAPRQTSAEAGALGTAVWFPTTVALLSPRRLPGRVQVMARQESGVPSPVCEMGNTVQMLVLLFDPWSSTFIYLFWGMV